MVERRLCKAEVAVRFCLGPQTIVTKQLTTNNKTKKFKVFSFQL